MLTLDIRTKIHVAEDGKHTFSVDEENADREIYDICCSGDLASADSLLLSLQNFLVVAQLLYVLTIGRSAKCASGLTLAHYDLQSLFLNRGSSSVYGSSDRCSWNVAPPLESPGL
ncbi:hypothetical protein ACO22_02574 [Paracoccidioides brasiliensis]|uniref:Uncharacterized protein n=1 Tax=Paracoccidioides brasiliensis TaxID=121759 RepID=A0A1D2JIP5_PARBR|nr:hypothetical protein ACO22_02574 [Paracoccidioides brasiliensis]